jgi:hypothetical protein
MCLSLAPTQQILTITWEAESSQMILKTPEWKSQTAKNKTFWNGTSERGYRTCRKGRDREEQSGKEVEFGDIVLD